MPLLELTDLYKCFGRFAAVAGVTLHVDAGEIVGLIGPNGSGKSTLLEHRCPPGAYQPNDGTHRLDGQNIGGLSPDKVFDAGLARSYQDPSLFFRMSALDNTLLPADRHAAGSMCGGPRSTAGGGTRSGSQQPPRPRQSWPTSISSIRAGTGLRSLRRPDETAGNGPYAHGRAQDAAPRQATAGVAPALAYTIFEEIERMRTAHGLTFLIVEHRLEILFDFVDRLYVMHMGQVIAEGKPAAIEQDPFVREVYFGE